MPGAIDFLPADRSLERLREAASRCAGCGLRCAASRAVFGDGPPDARLMFVGDAPGVDDDLAGRPFAGLTGRLLDRALAEVGIDRTEVYVTNVVKHLADAAWWEGAPTEDHAAVCRAWLEQEIAVVRPAILVCLGVVAARTLLGSGFRVSRERGRFIACPFAPHALATVHPSCVLGVPDEEGRRDAYRRFVADLARVAERMHWLDGEG